MLAVLVVLVLLSSSAQSTINSAWKKGSMLQPSTEIELTIALTQRNLQKLTAIAERVSDPNSPHYGDHLTLEEITQLVAPPAEHIQSVSSFFTAVGAKTQLTASNDFIVVRTNPAEILQLFGVTMYEWRHVASDRVIHRTDNRHWKYPSAVSPYIEVTTGLSDFFELNTERKLRKQQSVDRKNTVSSSAPDVYRLRGASSAVIVHMFVYCPNGDKAVYNTTTKAMFCDDISSEVSNYNIMITERGEPQRVVSLKAADMTCSDVKGCQTHNILITPFRRLRLSAQVVYTNGPFNTSKSAVGTYLPYYTPPPQVTPQTIYDTYHVPNAIRSTNPNNSQSVVAFEDQYINVDTDLYSYFAEMGIPHNTPIIHGTNNPAKPGEESTLDIQYIMGVGAGAKSTFWSVSGNVRKGAYILEWAMQVNNVSIAPLVTSISYGDTELGYYNNYGGWEYIKRMDTELTKMAARGMTVMAGSGDAGCSNVGEAGNDLSPTDATCTPFRPFYPSNSAWVLSVSSTFLSQNSKPVCEMEIQENPVVCSNLGEIAVGVATGVYWTTGGGFSNLTFNLRPSWQKDAVGEYMMWANTMGTGGKLPPMMYWNQEGRGYPDVATIGLNLIDVFAGSNIPISGTSASGPVMGGLVSLWNDARLNAGKKPLGRIAPLLYKLADMHDGAFNDVVVGNNFDGDVQLRGSKYPSTCPYGFETAPGWDPVTGLGSPNWQYIRDYIVSKLP